jgi:hypothetical protein
VRFSAPTMSPGIYQNQAVVLAQSLHKAVGMPVLKAAGKTC